MAVFNGDHRFGDLVRGTNGMNNGESTPSIFQALSQFSETAAYGHVTDDSSQLTSRID